MRQLTRTFPLLLAAALQLLPLLRNIVTSPVAGSSFAIILRWGIGAGAVVGAYDSISRASAPVVFTNPTNFNGTVGVYFTNNVAITNNGGDTGVFFVLTNKLGAVSSALLNGNSTTSCMPAGLVFKCYDLNTGSTAKPIYGAIYGTPTTPVTNLFVHAIVTYSTFVVETNFFITILPAISSSPPFITNQPASLTNIVGNNATLSVTNGGTAPFKYQWYYNTNTALLNQTNTSLTITNVQLTNAGMYSVAITNSAGSTNSAYTLLTVWQPPILTNQPVALTNNVGTTASFSVTAGGTPAPIYQWFFNTNTILAGQTAATLTLNNVQLTNAGIYSVLVTNSAGGTNSFYTPLTVWQPPVITNQSSSFTTVAGGSATFSVTAGGTPAPSFQWKFNTNTVLAGATGTTLSLANLRASQAGIYSVTVTNSAGGTNSAYVNLVVTNPPPPKLNCLVNASIGAFNFTFTPVIGLTNTILTNGVLAGGTWGVFTNIPPPVTATPITLTNHPAIPNLYYKVLIQP